MTFIKTFRAASLQAAIEKVRSELGPDASILETKSLQRSLTKFLSSDRIEVTASSTAIPSVESSNDAISTDTPIPLIPSSESSVASVSKTSPPRQTIEKTNAQTQTVDLSPEQSAETLPIEKDRGRIFGAETSNQTHQTVVDSIGVKNDWDVTLADLINNGIDAHIATQWLEDIYEDQLEDSSSETIRHLLVQSLQSKLPPCSAIDIDSETQQQVIALVGPTGSGKTTCIAKLAAVLAQQMPDKVGVLSLDTFRIGAVDQLNHYTSMLNIPLVVAAEPEQIELAIQSLTDCSVVLIDTPGMGPGDHERLNKVSHLLSLCHVDQVHLCLPATYSRSTFEMVLKTFRPLTPSHGILTHMDFSMALGNLFPVLEATSLNGDVNNLEIQLSYISNGQQVPTHFTEARPTHLAIKMLGNQS